MSATLDDITALRSEFPGLNDTVGGNPFVYLDSAATTQKHLSVIERMDTFQRHEYGTVHRGLYRRSAMATKYYEEARNTVAQFLGADSDEIVFTMGCTDAINLIAWSWGRAHLQPGDKVLVSTMEHHANIVPWQIISEITGCRLVECPIHDDGSLDLQAYERLLKEGVALVAIIHVANSLGTVNPVTKLCTLAHSHGAKVLVDAAQSAPHMPLDVKTLDCDFLTLSAHKCYGPTGIGALYAKRAILEDMPPWRGGGEMINKVTFAKTTFADPPGRFEAGTPPIVEAIGFAAACDFLNHCDRQRIMEREQALYQLAESLLDEIPGLRRIGRAPQRSTVLSFVMEGAHPADISHILDEYNVAIRAGHHCAQPTMQRFGISATARVSLGIYSNEADLQAAARALRTTAELFAR